MVLSWFPFFSTTLLDLGGGLVLKHVVFQVVLRAVEQQWLCVGLVLLGTLLNHIVWIGFILALQSAECLDISNYCNHSDMGYTVAWFMCQNGLLRNVSHKEFGSAVCVSACHCLRETERK